MVAAFNPSPSSKTCRRPLYILFLQAIPCEMGVAREAIRIIIDIRWVYMASQLRNPAYIDERVL